MLLIRGRGWLAGRLFFVYAMLYSAGRFVTEQYRGDIERGFVLNGLLSHFDTEGVLALIAPRPLLALTGELDTGSPADGVRALERAVGGTYRALGAGDRFRSVLYPETGHTYTPEMRNETLAWFGKWLKP